MINFNLEERSPKLAAEIQNMENDELLAVISNLMNQSDDDEFARLVAMALTVQELEMRVGTVNISFIDKNETELN